MKRFYETPWTRHRLIRAWNFMKLLRVEPYLFMVMFQVSLKATPSSQLLQDKICMLWHPTNATYCQNLPTSHETGTSPGHYKSTILAEVAKFGTYDPYISTVPGLIWALFAGAWIDRYVRGRKVLMLMSVGASIVENLIIIFLSIRFETSPYYIMLTHIPTTIFGGHIASRIAINHYMSSTTPPKLLAIRFMIFDICNTVASPIGSSLGGYLLVQKPILHTGEIRNYSLCFIISLGFELLALLWIIFMVNERIARKQEMRIEMKLQGIQEKNNSEGNKVKLRSDMSVEDEKKHPIRLLFDLGNMKTMLRTVFKKRSNKGRKQLFLLLASTMIHMMAFQGAGYVSGQFIQKIYFWGPDWTSYMKSITMVIHSIASISIVPFLIKVVKVHDIPLSIIGHCITFMTNIIQGTWLSSMAYYVCMPISALGGIGSIGTRSHMTKIVGRDEIGKVMSFIAAADILTPTISSTIFTYIFTATLDTYPGTVYQAIALLIMVSFYVLIWVDLFTERPFEDKQEKIKDHQDQKENDHDKNDGKHHDGHNKPQGHHLLYHIHHHKQNNEENKDSVVDNREYDMNSYDKTENKGTRL